MKNKGSVPAVSSVTKRTVIHLEESNSSEEEEEKMSSSGKGSTSSKKETYSYEFRDEKVNNINDENKGGFLNDLKVTYSSFLVSKQAVLKGNKSQHFLIQNLESLVLLLAYEKMQTEDGQLNGKEKMDVIILNSMYVLVTLLQNDPHWQRICFPISLRTKSQEWRWFSLA